MRRIIPKERVEVLAEGITLYQGDCNDILPTLAPVDAVLTDPPFGIGNFVQVTGRVRGRGSNVGRPVTWNNCAPNQNIFIKLRSLSRHRIIFGANFFNCFEDNGGAIVWLKRQYMPNFSKAEIASCSYLRKTEVVEVPWTNFTIARKAETDHPCERPLELYLWCINYLPESCITFLDPFMGSGSVGVAACIAGRRFIGIEVDPNYFDMACRRIDKVLRAPDLFQVSNVDKLPLKVKDRPGTVLF